MLPGNTSLNVRSVCLVCPGCPDDHNDHEDHDDYDDHDYNDNHDHDNNDGHDAHDLYKLDLYMTFTNWAERLVINKNIQKSNISSEGSRHPNFMNPFEYGQSFIGKSFPKRIETLTPTNP